jgi:hypothetical protein
MADTTERGSNRTNRAIEPQANRPAATPDTEELVDRLVRASTLIEAGMSMKEAARRTGWPTPDALRMALRRRAAKAARELAAGGPDRHDEAAPISAPIPTEVEVPAVFDEEGDRYGSPDAESGDGPESDSIVRARTVTSDTSERRQELPLPPTPPAPAVATIDPELLASITDRLTILEGTAAADDERLARLEGRPDGPDPQTQQRLGELDARLTDIGGYLKVLEGNEEVLRALITKLEQQPGVSRDDFARYDSGVRQAITAIGERVAGLLRDREARAAEYDRRLKAVWDRAEAAYLAALTFDRRGGRR